MNRVFYGFYIYGFAWVGGYVAIAAAINLPAVLTMRATRDWKLA